ncbi:hypothetical protein NDU88_005094 [Pleurodeles waltl]|uniref:Uncharacterized protein n=1 Tax=Pleurodeles waltl TaxID=8319 RepID=A0AAV7UKX7_PLEWA|nr:hypothetical protein NDU88_005094 [Pleurodeles waltl]
MSYGLRSGPQVRSVVQGASVSVLSANGSGNPCTQHVFISPPPFFVVFLFMCALASSGGGEVASEHKGAASHMAMAGHATDSDFTSETEGEGSSTAWTRADVSGSDSSSEGSSFVVAATSVPPRNNRYSRHPVHQHRPPSSPSAFALCLLTQEGGHLLRPRHLRPCPCHPCCPQ